MITMSSLGLFEFLVIFLVFVAAIVAVVMLLARKGK